MNFNILSETNKDNAFLIEIVKSNGIFKNEIDILLMLIY